MKLPFFSPSSSLLCILLPCLGLGTWAQSIPSDKCGQVFNTTGTIWAHDAYECLLTTPFNSTFATQLVTYWTDTLQFQSTLAYLKNPPRAYQQPSVDLLGGLQLIQDQIDNGVFSNQYSFEATVHSLLQKAHDFHISLSGGVLQVFAFTPNIPFASVSLDGFALPQVYDASDLYDWKYGSSNTAPSPIVTVNGQNAETFFATYSSRNSYGALEPHADWNQIMWSYAAAIQNYYDPFSSPFYSGDTLVLGFANGTSQTVNWTASYVGGMNIPLINTGQDLFDWFVLGQDTPSNIAAYGPLSTATSVSSGANPTATDDEAPSLTSVSAATSTAAAAADSYPGWGGAYPEYPDIYQPQLGETGYVTGYYLRDVSVGVLSIPSFDISDDTDAAQNFSDTVGKFVAGAKEAGMTKIVIDLQQNYGGQQLLAAETFGHFFPNIEPFSGMRTRSFDLENQLGTIMTNYFSQSYGTLNETQVEEFVNDPWAVTNELNAGTNQNFTSWGEYYGPHEDNGDSFSTVFRYNFTNPLYEWVAGGIDTSEEGLPSSAPYDAKDIVILTDSVCSSTCDLFVEMMHHQAGVRTIVVGGMPQEGPMQARGAARGGLSLNNIQNDANILFAATVNESISPALLDRDPEYAWLYSLQYNFADQIRPSEYVPLQFVYEAADCRIFWTPDTYFNYTLLWKQAAVATFSNASTCVARSAEHNNTMQTDSWGPSPEQLASWAATNPANAPANDTFSTGLSPDEIDFWVGMNEDWGDGSTVYQCYYDASVRCSSGSAGYSQQSNQAQIRGGPSQEGIPGGLNYPTRKGASAIGSNGHSPNGGSLTYSTSPARVPVRVPPRMARSLAFRRALRFLRL